MSALVRAVTNELTGLGKRSYYGAGIGRVPPRGGRTRARRRFSKRAPMRYLGPTLSTYASPMYDPFPGKQRVLFRYTESINVPSTQPGTFSTFKFRANSIQDPNLTGVGHRPYGYNQYSRIYNHYRVEKSMIRVAWVNTNNAALVGVALTDDATDLGDYNSIFEQKGCRRMVIGDSISTTQDSNTTSLAFNRPLTYLSNVSNTNANMGQNPTEIAIFSLYVRAVDPTLGTNQTTCMVSIDYYCTLWELQDLGNS